MIRQVMIGAAFLLWAAPFQAQAKTLCERLAEASCKKSAELKFFKNKLAKRLWLKSCIKLGAKGCGYTKGRKKPAKRRATKRRSTKRRSTGTTPRHSNQPRASRSECARRCRSQAKQKGLSSGRARSFIRSCFRRCMKGGSPAPAARRTPRQPSPRSATPSRRAPNRSQCARYCRSQAKQKGLSGQRGRTFVRRCFVGCMRDDAPRQSPPRSRRPRRRGTTNLRTTCARRCRLEAKRKDLSGEKARTYIRRCFKNCMN